MHPKSIVAALAFSTAVLTAAEPVFVEAESFTSHGGWSLDTAVTHVVGSPYLLAHGLGKPVADATTRVNIPAAGSWRVWVRTKDWVAPWKAPGTPGRFRLGINGRPLATEFGTKGADWAWQEGGAVELPAGEATLALRDLTGFDGRCDAILLSNDKNFTPPSGDALAAARRKWLHLGAGPDDAGEFDLVVVGGGYAGLASAITAARQSLKVALVQDRFVLGGNGSSEIRVWAQGGTMRGKYPHLGEIVEEFADRGPDSPGVAETFGDALKEAVARKEKNLTLFLGHFAMSAEVEPGGGRIKSVTALDVRTGRERKFRGKLFADCTGHGTLGTLAGAKHTTVEKGHMGMSNMWFWQDEDSPQPWPETPWALALEVGDFPKQVKSKAMLEGKPFMKGEWFWESGFDKHPIDELEYIRDWNFRAVFGAFTALKHGAEKDKHVNSALKWVAYVGGTRESRLLQGDVVLTQDDIVSQKDFKDGCVATTWDIDLHYPKEQFAKKGAAENPFISRAAFGKGVDRVNGYPVPYRCFYSTNVPNLFMAGRCISVTHEALGTVRVMRTCGMMGEVVGKAAYVCVKQLTTPRGVYENYWPQMVDLMNQPGAMRRDSLDAPLVRDTSVPAVVPYGPKTGKATNAAFVAATALPGIVIDDAQAKFTGKWSSGTGLANYVGAAYHYAGAAKDGAARYEFNVPKSGRYEIRLAWQPHPNRSTKTPCVLERDGQAPVTFRVNQREGNDDKFGFHSLGVFDFAAGKPCALVIKTDGADGNVHADAVQVIEAKE
jgi:hypothetical protein